MREKATHREHIELINEYFGSNKAVISFKEVQEFTGQSWKWCNKHLDVPHTGCTVVQLARALDNL